MSFRVARVGVSARPRVFAGLAPLCRDPRHDALLRRVRPLLGEHFKIERRRGARRRVLFPRTRRDEAARCRRDRKGATARSSECSLLGSRAVAVRVRRVTSPGERVKAVAPCASRFVGTWRCVASNKQFQKKLRKRQKIFVRLLRRGGVLRGSSSRVIQWRGDSTFLPRPTEARWGQVFVTRCSVVWRWVSYLSSLFYAGDEVAVVIFRCGTGGPMVLFTLSHA